MKLLVMISVCAAASAAATTSWWITPPPGPVTDSEQVAVVAIPSRVGGNADELRKSADSAASDAPSTSQVLDANIKLLEQAIERLRSFQDYTAKFILKERVDGELTDEQHVDLHLRHQPFSVRMKWTDKGRELVYVEGKHNQNLLVNLGGIRSLIGTLELDPEGDLAMAESRYPVTKVGLLFLCERLLHDRRADLDLASGLDGSQSVVECDGQLCDRIELQYAAPHIRDGYRRHVLLVSRKTGLPVSVQNFIFHETNPQQEVLVEQYVYRDVRPNVGLSDSDFELRASRTGRRIRDSRAQVPGT